MSQPPEASLQFDQAEFGTSGGSESQAAPATCGLCGKVLAAAYFRTGALLACSECRAGLERDLQKRPTAAHLFRAFLFGSGAALLGAALYYGVTKVTGYEIGLVSMAVGILVGRAVHKGGGQRGGRAFQLMAVTLAYLAMAGSYVPFVIEGIIDASAAEASAPAPAVGDAEVPAAPSETEAATAEAAPPEPRPVVGVPTEASLAAANAPAPAPAPAAPVEEPPGGLFGVLAMLVGLFLTLPIQVGMESPISGLILAFALWEGWRVNRKVEIVIEGPFELKPEEPTGTETNAGTAAVG